MAADGLDVRLLPLLSMIVADELTFRLTAPRLALLGHVTVTVKLAPLLALTALIFMPELPAPLSSKSAVPTPDTLSEKATLKTNVVPQF